MNLLYCFTEKEIHVVLCYLRRLLCEGRVLILGYHLPKAINLDSYIRFLGDARILFEACRLRYVLGLDLNHQVNKTYAGELLGEHLYTSFH